MHSCISIKYNKMFKRYAKCQFLIQYFIQKIFINIKKKLVIKEKDIKKKQQKTQTFQFYKRSQKYSLYQDGIFFH